MGEFCQTLNLGAVATGWTEPRALKNKARRWVVEASEDIRKVLPFPLLGLGSDKGLMGIDHLAFWMSEAGYRAASRSALIWAPA